MERKHREELKEKDELLNREVNKRRARTQAYVNCLDLLNRQEKALKSAELRGKALESNLRWELTLKEEKHQEEKKYKEEVEEETKRSEDGWRRMESHLREELNHKDELLKKETKKRKARTQAYVDCMNLLSQKEKDLKESEEQTHDALEKSLKLELALKDQREQEDKYKEKVEEETKRAEDELRRMESQFTEELKEKDELLNREINKRRLILRLMLTA
ncbi:trichohyalin isoform X1 [Lates calcarifer]|uniref:Trichohyalin isoform X1 n=1 Tax=Lates calcarifer TaxID=8187 RepID=A0AAJ8DSN0_LATCA|nr:trichohyalin isoform X1 [Lates calcarifer]